MSLKTWIKEFYPTTAKQCVKNGKNPAAHSLQKWVGLLKKNLKKHRCFFLGDSVFDDTDREAIDEDGFSCQEFDEVCSFTFSAETCSLCVAYFGKFDAERGAYNGHCANCPLAKLRNGVPCDCAMIKEVDGKNDPAPYSTESPGYPHVMIKLLRKAVKMEEATRKETKKTKKAKK